MHNVSIIRVGMLACCIYCSIYFSFQRFDLFQIIFFSFSSFLGWICSDKMRYFISIMNIFMNEFTFFFKRLIMRIIMCDWNENILSNFLQQIILYWFWGHPRSIWILWVVQLLSYEICSSCKFVTYRLMTIYFIIWV